MTEPVVEVGRDSETGLWWWSARIGEKLYGPFPGYHWDPTDYARSWRPIPPLKNAKAP